MTRQPNSYTIDTSTVTTTDAGFVINHTEVIKHIKAIKYTGYIVLNVLITRSTNNSVAITIQSLSTLTGISTATITRSIVRLANAGLITY